MQRNMRSWSWLGVLATFAWVFALWGCAKQSPKEMSSPPPGGSPPGSPGMAGSKAGMPGMPGGASPMGGEAEVQNAPSEGQAFAATTPPAIVRKVIMTGNVTLEVKHFEKVHAEVVTLAKQLNGYIANSELNLPTEEVQSGTVTLRVPQEKYDEAMRRIKKLGKAVTETQSAEDVTQKYVDLDARVRNLKAEEARVLDIMKRARTIKETLQVDARLTELREQIEVIEGQFRYLKFQIDMATITVTLTEKATALHLPEPKWVWFNHVKSAWHAVIVLAQSFATILTYVVIVGGIFGLPLLLFALWVRKTKQS